MRNTVVAALCSMVLWRRILREARRQPGSVAPSLAHDRLGRGRTQPGAFVEGGHQITGDSFIVDVRPIVGDPAEGFMEVFKYAVKFSDQPVATIHGTPFRRSRETPSWLCWVLRGVEGAGRADRRALDDLPYVELFYRYLHGKGLRRFA
jgi:hypothetical protein